MCVTYRVYDALMFYFCSSYAQLMCYVFQLCSTYDLPTQCAPVYFNVIHFIYNVIQCCLFQFAMLYQSH